MRWLLTTGLLLSAMTAFAQTRPPTAPETPPPPPDSTSTELPDAPAPAQAQQKNVVAVAEASFKVTGDGAHPCGFFSAMKVVYFDPSRYDQVPKPCTELFYPYQRFLTTNVVIPMTWQQKGYLALHDLTDPANFGTILGISAITIGANAHTAYGPGLKGFGKSVGVSLLQDATGQFFGAFAIPSLAHQDPRYFRMPHVPLQKAPHLFHLSHRHLAQRQRQRDAQLRHAPELSHRRRARQLLRPRHSHRWPPPP